MVSQSVSQTYLFANGAVDNVSLQHTEQHGDEVFLQVEKLFEQVDL